MNATEIKKFASDHGFTVTGSMSKGYSFNVFTPYDDHTRCIDEVITFDGKDNERLIWELILGAENAVNSTGNEYELIVGSLFFYCSLRSGFDPAEWDDVDEDSYWQNIEQTAWEYVDGNEGNYHFDDSLTLNEYFKTLGFESAEDLYWNKKGIA